MGFISLGISKVQSEYLTL